MNWISPSLVQSSVYSNCSHNLFGRKKDIPTGQTLDLTLPRPAPGASDSLEKPWLWQPCLLSHSVATVLCFVPDGLGPADESKTKEDQRLNTCASRSLPTSLPFHSCRCPHQKGLAELWEPGPCFLTSNAHRKREWNASFHFWVSSLPEWSRKKDRHNSTFPRAYP